MTLRLEHFWTRWQWHLIISRFRSIPLHPNAIHARFYLRTHLAPTCRTLRSATVEPPSPASVPFPSTNLPYDASYFHRLREWALQTVSDELLD